MPGGTSPADKLKQLQKELEDLAKDTARHNAQIASLTKIVAEIDQKARAYDQKTIDGLNEQKRDVEGYVDTERDNLLSILTKAKQKEVKDALDAGKNFKTLEEALENATEKYEKAQGDLATAKKKASDAQVAYDLLAKLPATYADNIKDLNALRALAKADQSAKKLAGQYFWILVMDALLNEIKFKKPEEYAAELNLDANALADELKAQTTAEETLQDTLAAKKSAQKNLDDAKVNWRKNTRDSIKEGEAKAPELPSGGGPAANAAAQTQAASTIVNTPTPAAVT